MWILMDIGCLLTGQLSRVVGRFEKLSDAQKIQHRCEEKYGIPSVGKHKFYIFPEPEPETIHERYEL